MLARTENKLTNWNTVVSVYCIDDTIFYYIVMSVETLLFLSKRTRAS